MRHKLHEHYLLFFHTLHQQQYPDFAIKTVPFVFAKAIELFVLDCQHGELIIDKTEVCQFVFIELLGFKPDIVFISAQLKKLIKDEPSKQFKETFYKDEQQDLKQMGGSRALNCGLNKLIQQTTPTKRDLEQHINQKIGFEKINLNSGQKSPMLQSLSTRNEQGIIRLRFTQCRKPCIKLTRSRTIEQLAPIGSSRVDQSPL